MLNPRRPAEIKALTWDWKYEDCSDHQSAVDDLPEERETLPAWERRIGRYNEKDGQGDSCDRSGG